MNSLLFVHIAEVWFLISISVIAFALGFWLRAYLTKQSTYRFRTKLRHLVRHINNLQVTNLSEGIHPGRTTPELASLVEALNQMLDRLESAFRVQKNFIDNSSHELRTPLTAITGQLEVTLLQDRCTAEYKAALLSILEDIKNLNLLTNRLLILSRADSQFVADGFSHLRIDDIIWKTRTELLKLHPSFIVNIHFDETITGEHHFNIFGNDQLLKTAFSNLIENGCKYSDNHKTDVYLSIANDCLNILFADEGIGIFSDEHKLIFQPFYRGRNVKKERGHGIGLSLVDKIINLHDGTIHINSVPGNGSKFGISLPLVD